jgi:hypothetical protein
MDVEAMVPHCGLRAALGFVLGACPNMPVGDHQCTHGRAALPGLAARKATQDVPFVDPECFGPRA